MALIDQTFIGMSNRNYQGGDKRTAEFAVPVGVDRVEIIVNRSTLLSDVDRLFSLTTDLSLDGGVTWSSDEAARAVQSFGAFPIKLRANGLSVLPDGTPVGTESRQSAAVPLPLNANRRARFTLDALKGMQTTVSIHITGAT